MASKTPESVRGPALVPACRCAGQASGACAGCYRDLAEVEEHYDDGDALWCADCVPRAEWVDGRLVDPAHPQICVHHVGVSPGLWCGACREGPS